ncbi:4-hydroxythreonine-4-phosphate dehydrogenase PdxA [Aquifex aeolicus]|uniref:4-hydroxythreonine-4-phosphate dehydrogenase n=1 Tax=Aquifex aeolicus (strain VF5) TaxID=224324 RepID=PDXA_AQUAE|nr:4-hydroxythreonine-4-phosphate dehydrogenase PdxA [Aquifex aeolicus]O67019.1 RecName: Full=4-hydroxythreonine-4-phosphate dehydrogenase; AltName: Full=4-(phosphohydroxy)-L-threonine dehydrogenase [Aquifex aeolicus VF5]AAC06973.1 pyridoxal phosphate biosynthetic protein PdxA [Aquifex aeolicus VF5]
MNKKIGITLGDPAGIGPELILKISKHFKEKFTYVIYGEEKTLLEASKLTGIKLNYKKIEKVEEAKERGVYLIDLNVLKVPVVEPSVSSGKAAVAYLARAVADAIRGNIHGILTMPINKFWAKKAGFQYEGQTEFLAKASGTKDYAMMMYSEKLKVVLLTTHIPLKDVPNYVKKEEILKKVRLIRKEFLEKFKFEPLIKVLGLNPHAGEMGELGREEIEEIIPAVEEAKKEGIKVVGPLVPDVAFINPSEEDVFLCMYHDQGLIPFKMLAFDEGVNFTLGLPFIRTSPDHGTAYDIAWKNKARESSSLHALRLIEDLLDKI